MSTKLNDNFCPGPVTEDTAKQLCSVTQGEMWLLSPRGLQCCHPAQVANFNRCTKQLYMTEGDNRQTSSRWFITVLMADITAGEKYDCEGVSVSSWSPRQHTLTPGCPAQMTLGCSPRVAKTMLKTRGKHSKARRICRPPDSASTPRWAGSTEAISAVVAACLRSWCSVRSKDSAFTSSTTHTHTPKPGTSFYTSNEKGQRETVELSLLPGLQQPGSEPALPELLCLPKMKEGWRDICSTYGEKHTDPVILLSWQGNFKHPNGKLVSLLLKKKGL